MVTLSQILKNKKFLLLSILLFFSFLFLIIWIPNFPVFKLIIFSQKISLFEKFRFLITSPNILVSNSGAASIALTILVLILTSLNITLLVYFIKRSKTLPGRNIGINVLGVFPGLLGVGCSSCGSLILSLLGLSGFAAILPFRGIEFSFVGIFLLIFSIHNLLKSIANVDSCKIS